MTDTDTTAPRRVRAPLARDAIRQLAESRGGCLRPVQLRRTDTTTGQVTQLVIPCGSTLEATCPSCAQRARSLRAEQCREGWHLDRDPDPGRPAPDESQEFWLTLRAEVQVRRDHAHATGMDTAELDQAITEIDDELARAGIRGSVSAHTASTTSTNGGDGGDSTGQPASKRRTRSTRRRQDTPDLPKRPVTTRTTGLTWTAPDGRQYQPSMFVTLTCDSYGKVDAEGIPADPAAYDYARAARDAIHFAALFDRLIQNLRRYLGYDVQYFAAIEPQKRLAPHAHVAFRGAISRADLRQVIAATYHQVWWPSTAEVRYHNAELPEWHPASGHYVDPATGEVLPTWDQALNVIGLEDEPAHVARFGPRFDAQGVLPGSKDAGRCIGYLTKYLTKQIAGCHTDATAAAADHSARLLDALRYEPCSPTCANWLRYGVQPKDARAGLIPGLCKGKAHRAENLGYAGRRVLVSRRWSGKTLADHRASRKAWLLAMLDLPATQNTAPDPCRYSWERVTPADPDNMPPTQRLLHILTDRARWQAALTRARRKAAEQQDPPAAGRAA